MNETPQSQPMRSTQPAIRVLLAVLLAVSVTGYFVGLRQSRQASEKEPVYGREAAPSADEHDVPFAVEYAKQPRWKVGPNRDWHSDLTSLRQPAATPPPKQPASPEAVAALLQSRASRRAFDGAPPVVPHPTPPLGVAACLACHEKGATIGDKQAAKMSHPLYVNCTQCHVEVVLPGNQRLWENTFAAFRPAPAERAFPGAPPAVPHPAWMRNDCQSCHGAAGPAPLRTTHPERQNCLQCHALSFPQDLLPYAAPGHASRRVDPKSPTKE
jgi:cytochrome c-type protein NapB